MTDFAPWSVSKANVAYDCTLRFNLQYAQRKKGITIQRAEGRIGSGVHFIIERMLLGDEYDVAFRAGANSTALTRNEILELHTFKSSIHRFMARLEAFKEQFGMKSEDVLVEKKMGVTEDLRPAPFWDDNKDTWIRGAADVILRVRRDGKKFLIIIDHKSGEIKPLETYEAQLNTYGIMGLYHEEDVAGVQTCIHWPRADNDADMFSWGPMWSADHVRNELVPWMREFLAEAQQRVDDPPVATAGWFCDFCNFQHTCPLKIAKTGTDD